MSVRAPKDLKFKVVVPLDELKSCEDWIEKLWCIRAYFEAQMEKAVFDHAECPAVRLGDDVFLPFSEDAAIVKMLAEMHMGRGLELTRDEALEDGRYIVELADTRDPEAEPVQAIGYSPATAMALAWQQAILSEPEQPRIIVPS